MTKEEYKCPLCDTVMTIIPGDNMNPRNGFTVKCYVKKCPSTENVEGHGETAKAAFNIACLKFNRKANKGKDTHEETEEMDRDATRDDQGVSESRS